MTGSASFDLTMKPIWNLLAKEQIVPALLLMISSGSVQSSMKIHSSEADTESNVILFLFGLNENF